MVHGTNNPIRPFTTELDHAVTLRINHIGIVTKSAIHLVIANTSIEIIIARTARKLVSPLITNQGVILTITSGTEAIATAEQL